jgi:alpha-1,6-mannosyltransferase
VKRSGPTLIQQRRGGSLSALAQRIDRLGLARNWDQRSAHRTLALLVASTVAALVSPQPVEFWTLLVASAAFVVLICMEARHPALQARTVLWCSLVLLAVAVLAAPRNSDDVWSYAMYGHMVTHYHADPYRISPLAYSGDPWFWRVSNWWQDTRTVYGPVFTALSAAGMIIAGSSALRARLFFQLLTALAIAGSLGLLYRRKVDAGALAFVGLSPVIVVNVVNGGHNDALVGLGVLAGVLAFSKRWRFAAGAVLGLTALVKLIALLPAAALVVWVWRREGRRCALLLLAVIGAVVAAGYLLIGGVAALAPLSDASRLVNQWSLWGWFGHLAPPASTGQGPLGGLLVAPVAKHLLTGWARYAGTGLVLVVGLVVIVAGSGDSRPSAGAAAAILAFVLATPYIQPWYLAAMLPLLALQWRSRLAVLGAGYSILLVLADSWQSSTGLVHVLLRIPLSTVFIAWQALALGMLVALAIRQLREAPLRNGLLSPGRATAS